MAYKISSVFVVIIGLLMGFKKLPQQPKFKCGEYQATHNGLKFIINIKSDSSFQYKKIQKLPVEYTYGKWRINKNVLILNSVPDTLKFRSGRYLGAYVFFENQKYFIKNDKIADKNNREMEYSLNDSTVKSL